MMMNLMTILVKKVFISSKPTFVYLLCPPLCGPFSIQESAAGGLSYKARNFKFKNLKLSITSSYDTEVLKYIESLKESVFIIYCQHGAASMYMGFIVADGKYGTVLRFEYNSLYINGCSGDAWAGWTKLG